MPQIAYSTKQNSLKNGFVDLIDEIISKTRYVSSCIRYGQV